MKTFKEFLTTCAYFSEDYKKLPRERMQQQYNRKKDKNYDEFLNLFENQC